MSKKEKLNPKSLVAIVNKEIGTATAASYLKGLAKVSTGNKLRAMIAAGIHCNGEITKPKLAKISADLEAFDIKSERHAENYIKGGFVAIKSQMTEHEIDKLGIARLQKFANKLLKEEVTSGVKAITAQIVEWEAELEKKRQEKADKADAEKAARKQATQDTSELLNESFEGDALTDTRVYAHVTTYFADISHMIERVLSDNASTAMKRLKGLIMDKFTELEKADKKEAETKLKKASGDK